LRQRTLRAGPAVGLSQAMAAEAIVHTIHGTWRVRFRSRRGIIFRSE
jgi:hypothetical protein